LLQGANFLAIPLLDHIILGDGDYQSLREITTLWQEYPQGD
jgi:DNA repair protein RadC